MKRLLIVLVLGCYVPAFGAGIFDVYYTAPLDSPQLNYHSLEAGFRYEDFKNPYRNRTFTYLQYGRTIKRIDLFAKVLLYRFGSWEGYQFESEFYWKFKKQGYFYFDAAYSNSFILPNYRLRAEVFQNAGQVEYSIGAGVVKPHVFREIPLVTGTIGYYFSDYFIYARPTFSYVDNGWTKSIFIQGRRYFTKSDFVAVSVLKGADTGTSRAMNAVANTFGADTYMFRVNAQMKRNKYKFGMGLDYGGIYIPESSAYATFVGIDVFINRMF